MQSVITQKSLYPAGEFLSLFPEVTSESEDAEEVKSPFAEAMRIAKEE